MARFAFIACGLGLLLAAPAARAQDSCTFCFDAARTDPEERPLSIDITGGLEFSRLAMAGTGGGSAAIDPQTGEKRTAGAMVDLGGVSVQGHARITGTPMRAVRVDLPSRVTLTTAAGGRAELTDFTTSLSAYPVLDASGTLEFTFGARLVVSGPVGGNFRGRIPITVDYN